MRALLETASHFYEVVVLELRISGQANPGRGGSDRVEEISRTDRGAPFVANLGTGHSLNRLMLFYASYLSMAPISVRGS